jgi:cytoskeletal protein CcmA (bactofilin family)
MSFIAGRKQHPDSDGDPSSAHPAGTAARQPVGFETILGESATLKGELRSQGNTRLDGTFEGTLEIDGNVLVGETGKITADINAKNISIAGAVRGNVSGKKVQLLRTARVWGDISAAAISTEEGAFIDGKITMVSHEAAQPLDPTTLPPPDESA